MRHEGTAGVRVREAWYMMSSDSKGSYPTPILGCLLLYTKDPNDEATLKQGEGLTL